MCTPQSGSLRDVHRVIQRREEGGRRQRWPGGKKGGIKRREIQPVVTSLNVLHSPENTKRFTELGREEKREGGDRGDLVEKKESPKRESSQASNLAPK